MKIKIEIDGAEALNDFIPALLRKHDETSHKLAHIFIDAVTSNWHQSVEGYEHCKMVINTHNLSAEKVTVSLKDGDWSDGIANATTSFNTPPKE